jgi:hypothetical protein
MIPLIVPRVAGDQAHHAAVAFVCGEGALNRVDLPSKAADPIQRLLLLNHCVSHRVFLYPGIVAIYPWEYVRLPARCEGSQGPPHRGPGRGGLDPDWHSKGSI